MESRGDLTLEIQAKFCQNNCSGLLMLLMAIMISVKSELLAP